MVNDNENENSLMICECGCPEHNIILTKEVFDGYNQYYVYVSKPEYLGFFNRLKWAFKYVFNLGPNKFPYAEFVVNKKSHEVLKKFVEEYEKDKLK